MLDDKFPSSSFEYWQNFHTIGYKIQHNKIKNKKKLRTHLLLGRSTFSKWKSSSTAMSWAKAILETLFAAFIISSRVTKPGGEAEINGGWCEEVVLCLQTIYMIC